MHNTFTILHVYAAHDCILYTDCNQPALFSLWPTGHKIQIRRKIGKVERNDQFVSGGYFACQNRSMVRIHSKIYRSLLCGLSSPRFILYSLIIGYFAIHANS